MPSGGMLKPTQSSPKVQHNPASKSSPRQSHSESDGTFTSPFGPSRQRSSNLTYSHGCPGVSQSITTSPALQSTVNIHVSALVETFQSHQDGGLGSWNISVADNFTMGSQTLWHGSRPLRNDWIRKQTERKRKPVLVLLSCTRYRGQTRSNVCPADRRIGHMSVTDGRRAKGLQSSDDPAGGTKA